MKATILVAQVITTRKRSRPYGFPWRVSCLDPAPIKLYSITPSGGMWSVASDGNNWVIAFEGSSASTDLMAMRISPQGVVLDPPIYTLVPATYYSRPNLRLAYANGVFLLTWADFTDTMAIRFDQQLNLLDASPHLLLSSWNFADLTSNGSQFYAVWISQDPPNYLITVTGSRISTDGIMLDGNGVNISDTHEPDTVLHQRVWYGMARTGE